MKKTNLIIFTVIAILTLTALTGCGSKSGAGGSETDAGKSTPSATEAKYGNIVIGTQTYTETKILAQMYKALIEANTSVKAEVKPDLASSPVIISAMKQDEVQMATLYSGEIFNNHFPVEQTHDRDKVLQQAKDGFKKTFNINWFDPLGFENTYAFTVRQDVADKNHLEKISDVKAMAGDMKLGVDTTWLERDNDGYRAFQETYGFKFGKTFPMEIGLVYDAVANKEVDIVLAYSTDPRLKQLNLKTLKDDKHFFPPYDASPVIKNEVLDAHPEVADAIKPLLGKIDAETMTALNLEVDVNKKDPKDVAIEFLKQQGLLK